MTSICTLTQASRVKSAQPKGASCLEPLIVHHRVQRLVLAAPDRLSVRFRNDTEGITHQYRLATTDSGPGHVSAVLGVCLTNTHATRAHNLPGFPTAWQNRAQRSQQAQVTWPSGKKPYMTCVLPTTIHDLAFIEEMRRLADLRHTTSDGRRQGCMQQNV